MVVWLPFTSHSTRTLSGLLGSLVIKDQSIFRTLWPEKLKNCLKIRIWDGEIKKTLFDLYLSVNSNSIFFCIFFWQSVAEYSSSRFACERCKPVSIAQLPQHNPSQQQHRGSAFIAVLSARYLKLLFVLIFFSKVKKPKKPRTKLKYFKS